MQTSVVTVTNDGALVPGVGVQLKLRQIQWNSVRRAEGQGFYTWETTRTTNEISSWTVTTAANPVAVGDSVADRRFSSSSSAVAKDAEGHSTTTKTSFYSLGTGFTRRGSARSQSHQSRSGKEHLQAGEIRRGS
jgi:hypothetical protein